MNLDKCKTCYNHISLVGIGLGVRCVLHFEDNGRPVAINKIQEKDCKYVNISANIKVK